MPKDYKVALLLDIYGEILTEKQRDMVDLYYNEDMSLGEISQNAGISRQGVRDAIKRAESVLFEMEEKLAFMQRYEDLLQKVAGIRHMVDAIDKDNETFHYSMTIRRNTAAIKETINQLLRNQ